MMMMMNALSYTMMTLSEYIHVQQTLYVGLFFKDVSLKRDGALFF